jgi:hypothetical protein
MRLARILLTPLLLSSIFLVSCSSGADSAPADAASPLPVIKRPGFLGAFFRPIGTIPYGVFSVYSKQKAPDPYPTPRAQLFGANGYCDAMAENGVSISSGYLVDAKKLANIVDLGVGWARLTISSDFDDQSHLFGRGRYAWTDMDSAQCALLRHHIDPVVGIEAGPVQYNLVPDAFAPKELPVYKTADDFGGYCGAVAAHEHATFRSVHRYSIPDNEVNSATTMFPGGEQQIAAYTEACYRAIKAIQPDAVVYGFELNMDKGIDPAGFVSREYDLGCRKGTCYDAISIHMYLKYPVPPPSAPCDLGRGGQYSVACAATIRQAAHDPELHILIGETAFLIPATVPDEADKAIAIVATMKEFADDPLVDGVNYANVDECDFYPSGFFMGGCLVDSTGNRLPAYAALRALATTTY